MNSEILPITDITKFSFQDFPNHTSCIIWFGGCNFRCPYCHNPEFVIEKFNIINIENVWEFLTSRVGLLDGVVLSGGECTLFDLHDFILKIKKMNFKVKIDTNGTNPNLIKKLIQNNLLDYVALDYKSTKEKFYSITNTNKFDIFNETLDFLIFSKIEMEIRTTVHTQLLNENDINEIIQSLYNKGYKGEYCIQNYRNDNKKTLGNVKDQEYILNKDKIIKDKINVNFRNFF